MTTISAHLKSCNGCDVNVLRDVENVSSSDMGVPDSTDAPISGTDHLDKCHRCRQVLEHPHVPTFDEAKSTTQQRHNISYQREEALLSCFIPNPDLGIGWCQALRQRRGGLKGLYLSPLGYLIKDKSGEIDKVKAIEDVIDVRLQQELHDDMKSGERFAPMY